MENAGQRLRISAAVVVMLCAMQSLLAEEPADVTEVRAPLEPPRPPSLGPYLVQPGDVLMVSVWKEQDLQGEVLVQPDGAIALPLVGAITAGGKSTEELRAEIAKHLLAYMPKPVVTVAVRAIGGNRVYVLGKVNKPGEFPLGRPLDVMQALSLAGGTAQFAALNDIVVLRRENGVQLAIRFRYADVERGRDLEQNILLKSGDTVVVP